MKSKITIQKNIFSAIAISIVVVITAAFLMPRNQGSTDAFSGPTRPTIPMVQVGMFALDYSSYKIIGHKFFNFQKTYSDTIKGIPLVCNQNMAGDFGNFSIQLIGSPGNLAAGSIIWMGTGQLTEPVLDTMKYSTEGVKVPLKKPSSISYLNKEMTENDKLKTEKVFSKLKNLQILQGFNNYPFKVGYYLYTPRVGKTDYSVAMWLFFISIEY